MHVLDIQPVSDHSTFDSATKMIAFEYSICYIFDLIDTQTNSKGEIIIFKGVTQVVDSQESVSELHESVSVF